MRTHSSCQQKRKNSHQQLTKVCSRHICQKPEQRPESFCSRILLRKGCTSRPAQDSEIQTHMRYAGDTVYGIGGVMTRTMQPCCCHARMEWCDILARGGLQNDDSEICARRGIRLGRLISIGKHRWHGGCPAAAITADIPANAQSIQTCAIHHKPCSITHAHTINAQIE